MKAKVIFIEKKNNNQNPITKNPITNNQNPNNQKLKTQEKHHFPAPPIYNLPFGNNFYN